MGLLFLLMLLSLLFVRFLFLTITTRLSLSAFKTVALRMVITIRNFLTSNNQFNILIEWIVRRQWWSNGDTELFNSFCHLLNVRFVTTKQIYPPSPHSRDVAKISLILRIESLTLNRIPIKNIWRSSMFYLSVSIDIAT